MTVAARPGLASSTIAIVWIALAAASQGVLADLFGLWATDAWSRYSLLFLPLAAFVVSRDPGGVAQLRLGAALVGLGAVIEVLAIGGGFDRIGRAGLALALLGMTCFHGVEGWSRRLCVCWIMPLPHGVSMLYGKVAIALMAPLGAATVALLGPELRFADPSLWYDSAGLRLRGPAGGLPVLVVLAGLGWHTSAVSGAPLRATAWRAVRWGALGIPIQAGAVVVAAFALAWFDSTPSAVRNGLSNLPWFAGAAVGLVLFVRSLGEPRDQATCDPA